MLCGQASKRRTRNALRPANNKVGQFLGTLGSRKAEERTLDAVEGRREGLRSLEVEFLELDRTPGAASRGRRLSGRPPYFLAPLSELHDELAGDGTGRPDHEKRSRHQSASTACVCTTSATRRPVASRTSVCSTIVRRPTCATRPEIGRAHV